MPVGSLQSLILAAVVGALAGTHTAIWGMYKDAIHEGFTVARFARSIVIGGVVAVAIHLALGLDLSRTASLVVLFGLAYAAERGIVETRKTFVRDEDQSKYFIPMQFTILGKPVASRGARLAAGAGYVAAVALCLYGIARLDTASSSLPRMATIVLVGAAVGTIVAIGGAWKDAPKEGFETLKFFRSPATTIVYALLLSFFTDSLLQIAVAALGFERATSETYKTFFFPSKPRGKFTGKRVLYPEMLVRRRYFVPVYVAIWIAVIVSGAIALRQTASSRAPARPAVAELPA